jgi:peptide deformylase
MVIRLDKSILYDKIEELKDKELMRAYVACNEVLKWIKSKPAYAIALNQLNLPYKAFVIKKHKDIILPNQIIMNPAYTPFSDSAKKIESEEGCLSYPGDKYVVERHEKIHCTYYSFIDQKQITMTVSGITAIVFQHETDHLNGISCKDISIRQL